MVLGWASEIRSGAKIIDVAVATAGLRAKIARKAIGSHPRNIIPGAMNFAEFANRLTRVAGFAFR